MTKISNLYALTNQIYVNSSGTAIGIGTTTPSSKLEVAGSVMAHGALTLGSGYAINFYDKGTTAYTWIEGSSYNQSYSFLAFTTGGSEKVRIDSSGNFGIGVAIPSYKLDVNGTGRFTGQVFVSQSTYTFPALSPSSFGYSSSYNVLILGNSNSAQSRSLAFNVDVSGNPSGAFNGYGSEYIWRNAGSFITPNSSNNGYNTLLSWNSSGQLNIPNNVGIGTTAPTLALSVIGQVRAGYATGAGVTIGLSPIGVPNNDLNAYVLWGDNATFGGENGDLIYIPRTSTSGSHRFYTGSFGLASEKMRITSGGNVGIGTGTPSDLLTLYRNASADNRFAIYQGTNGYASFINLIGNDDAGTAYNGILSRTGSNTAHWQIGGGGISNTLKIYTVGQERLIVTSNGQIQIPGQPAWSVGRSTGQSFLTNVPATINWDQSSGNDCFIQGGVTLNGSNGRITVPVAGKYVILVSIRTEAPGAATGTNLNFRKNGGTVLRYYVGTSVNSTGTYMYLETRPVVVSCAANDYLDFYFDSVTNDFSISAVTNTVVRFSGYLIG